MSIALLYERSDTDELGIKQTAREAGIKLEFIPFRKIALALCKNDYSLKTKGKDYTDTIKNVGVVLNRAQSKNRRLLAATFMERNILQISNSPWYQKAQQRDMLKNVAIGSSAYLMAVDL